MPFHDRPVFPRGFRCASRNVGLKPTAKDLALFVSDVDAAAAAVFTRNKFPGAPVLLGRETIKGGTLRAIFANSKVSNVATGAVGLENARRMAALERTAFLTRELIDLLVELQASDDVTLTDTVRDRLAHAIRESADLIATPLGDPGASDRFRGASEALAEYQSALGTPTAGRRTELAAGAAVELCLRRIIDVTRPFV